LEDPINLALASTSMVASKVVPFKEASAFMAKEEPFKEASAFMASFTFNSFLILMVLLIIIVLVNSTTALVAVPFL